MRKMISGLALVAGFVCSVSLVQGATPMLAPRLNHAGAGEIRGVFQSCGPEGAAGVLVYIPGESFMLKTGDSGEFVFHNVPVGNYSLVFEVPGKTTYIQGNVVVRERRGVSLGTVNYCTDNDGDGYSADNDCNDNNSNVNPGATEICDGIDNNCDGVVDEGCQTCTDADADGYYAQSVCGPAVDCNDASAAIYPGAPEVCDNQDNDCDGMTDEDVIPPPGMCVGGTPICLSGGWVCN